MRTVMTGILTVLFALVLLAAVPALGAWWLWSSQRGGASAPVGARLMFGIGLGLAVFAIVGGVIQLGEKVFGEGALVNVLTFFVLAAAGAGAIFGYRAFTEWAHRPQPVVAALGTVCNTGHGVTQAQSLQGAPPFHAVVVGEHGEEIDWSRHSAAWRATSVADTELVACVSRTRVLVETCLYHPARHPGTVIEVTRYRSVANVRVLAARNARVVDRFTVSNEPRSCRPEESSKVTSIENPVTFTQLSNRLAPIASTGRALTAR